MSTDPSPIQPANNDADTAARSGDLKKLPDRPVPDFIAHWVVKTTRSQQMITWYGAVFGARVVHEDSRIAFLTWDSESHRLALVKIPGPVRYLFPLAKFRRKLYGIDHLAFTFTSLERLLLTYERLERAGITPVWAINHGPTTSIYYQDPDGIRLEFQTENYPTAAETAKYMNGPEFAENPYGVNFDPGYLLERLRTGTDPTTLLKRGAGTRPGTRSRANRRTVTLKTL